MACAATLSASVNVQRMAVHAALNGDVMLLKQAMLHDPLTAAVCNPPEVWQMADEMLVAQSKWLPQYRPAMRAARKRLAECPAACARKPQTARQRAKRAPGRRTKSSR